MTNHTDSCFINGWRRDFISMRVALNSLQRRYEECRTNKTKIEWEASCVERAIAAMLEPKPLPVPGKRGPKTAVADDISGEDY